MNYIVGDQVIHTTYGRGEIIRVETKQIDDQLVRFYIFKSSQIIINIPFENAEFLLRKLTPPDEFIRVYEILRSPPETLDGDRLRRKFQLLGMLRDGQMTTVAKVVRDLRNYQYLHPLHEDEQSILDQAEQTLLAEWNYALGMPVREARYVMISLLTERSDPNRPVTGPLGSRAQKPPTNPLGTRGQKPSTGSLANRNGKPSTKPLILPG